MISTESTLFEKLRWKDRQSQRKIAKGTLVYKALNGLTPDYLAQMFTELNVVNVVVFKSYSMNSSRIRANSYRLYTARVGISVQLYFTIISFFFV